MSRNYWNELQRGKLISFNVKDGKETRKIRIIKILKKTKADIDLAYVVSNYVLEATLSFEDCHSWEDTLRYDNFKFDLEAFQSFFIEQTGDCVGELTKNQKIIYDADNYNFDARFPDSIGISYGCVGELFGLDLETFSNKLEIVDSVPDQQIPLRENTSIDKLRKLLKDGYTIRSGGLVLQESDLDINNNNKETMLKLKENIKKYATSFAHKASSCVVKYENQYALLGFDDSQYFGCILPEKCSTIKQAEESLKPKDLGKSYQRQGEWFVEPVDIKDGAIEGLDIFGSRYNIANVKGVTQVYGILPKDHEDANNHEFFANIIKIFNNNIYFKNLILSHPQHNKIEVKGWSRVLKNRAVLSVSTNGVD